jgi:phenylalanyl-tRNA synthetase alpha subunit
VFFHKFCDDCYSSRKEKSSAENESSALDDVPATVREQNHNRKLTSLKKKMAQMSSVRNKQKREALLQQANALLADMTDALSKKNKKKKDEEEHEAGLAELTVDAPATGELSIHAPKPKPKKTAQDDELSRTLARCTVQRFASCSVPSNFTL